MLNIFTLSQATHLSANLSFHLSNYDILIIVFTMWHTMDNTRDKICFYLQPVVKLTFWHVPLNKKWLYLQMKFWLLEALNLHIRLYLDYGFNIFYTKEKLSIFYSTKIICETIRNFLPCQLFTLLNRKWTWLCRGVHE